MIPDIEANKKLIPIVTELFLRKKKRLNISLAFASQSYFKVPRTIKLSPIVTELFLRKRELNISFAFISQSYFKVPKPIRLNTTHYFISK